MQTPSQADPPDADPPWIQIPPDADHLPRIHQQAGGRSTHPTGMHSSRTVDVDLVHLYVDHVQLFGMTYSPREFFLKWSTTFKQVPVT